MLSAALDAYFPPHIRVIGEPGRFYVSSAFTIACHVIARRAVADPALGTKSYMLYLNDGVYGNFSSIIFDHQQPVPRVLQCGSRFLHSKVGDTALATAPLIDYSIWGPTCDGIDAIAAACSFPEAVDVGDWLYFEDMGGTSTTSRSCVMADRCQWPSAYTKCSATRFNGFTDAHDVIYVCSEPSIGALLNV